MAIDRIKPNAVDNFFAENVTSIHYDFYKIVKRQPKRTAKGLISTNYIQHKLTGKKFYAHSETFKEDRTGKIQAELSLQTAFKKGIDVPTTHIPKVVTKTTKSGKTIYYKEKHGKLKRLTNKKGKKALTKYEKKLTEIKEINKYNEKQFQARKFNRMITSKGKGSKKSIFNKIKFASKKGKNARKKLRELEAKQQIKGLTRKEVKEKKKLKNTIQKETEKIEGKDDKFGDRIKGLLDELYNL